MGHGRRVGELTVLGAETRIERILSHSDRNDWRVRSTAHAPCTIELDKPKITRLRLILLERRVAAPSG